MKFVLAVALLCIGAVAAQSTSAPNNTGKELVITLEKRANALLHRVRETLETLYKEGHFHLAGSLEHQAVLVEALALDLGRLVQSKDVMHHIHHIHVIEEDLLFLENRVSEEIAIIDHFRHGGHHPDGHETTAQLVARGEKLVKEAKEAVAKFPKAKEVREIESNIIVVEALIKAIQAKPAPDAQTMKKDEEELARQEKTLRQLIEKASHRGHGF